MSADTYADPVRIAVLGVGTIARAVHLPLLRRSPSFELMAVSDLDQTRAQDIAQRYGARATDASGLFNDTRVEAVLIATPGNHAALALEALAAGKHVLAEKPLALTAADAEAADAAARERGLVLQVGAMKMYDVLVPLAREALQRLGGIRLVEVEVRHPADQPQQQHLRFGPSAPLPAAAAAAAQAADAADSERVRQALGDVPLPWQRFYRNVLCGSVLHELTLLRALGITLPDHFDHADVFPWPADGPPSITATATLSPTSRLVLSWNWLPDYPEYREALSVIATSGALRLDVAPPYVLDARSSLEVVVGGDAHIPGSISRPIIGRDGAFQRQLEAFATSIRQGSPVLSDADGAARDVRCLQALFRTVAERFGVELGGEAEQGR